MYTLQALRELLVHEFPVADVLTATSAQDGLEAIRNGHTLDAAVLDCRIPGLPGDHIGFSWAICEELRRRNSGVPIVHISAFVADPEVQGHMDTFHRADDCIAKLSPAWSNDLVSRLKQRINGPRIDRLMDEIFGDGRSAALPTLRAAVNSSRRGSITQSLATLIHDIESSWPSLAPMQKDRIRTYFHVEEAAESVKIALA
jgi:CheY-like chemotaxis protein